MITLTNGVQIPENAVQLQTTAAIDGYYVTQPLRLVQYDETLPVAAVQLTYQNQPYTPPTGAELNVRMGKPDGTTVYNPCLGMDSSGIVYFAFTQQMTIVAGTGTLTVEITDSGVKNSAPIIAEIRPNPVPEGAIASTDEFLTLQEILAEAEKWGQIVQTNASNIQQVVDNLTDIQNAAENAQAAAASAAAAQQAAQEALGFRTFFSAVRPDANGNLDPSRPMTVGPAASMEIESKGDRIQSVTALGFTTQAGSGDPSPTNVRALTNGGLKLVEQTFDGSSDENWLLDSNSGGPSTSRCMYIRLGVNVPNDSGAAAGVLYASYLKNTTPGDVFSGASGVNVIAVQQSTSAGTGTIYLRIAGISTVEALKAYLQANPLPVWYQPADESDATGLYAPIILTSGEYRATCLPLTAPLCEGDSAVSWARSGCDVEVTFDGSEQWTLAESGSGWLRAFIPAAGCVPGTAVGDWLRKGTVDEWKTNSGIGYVVALQSGSIGVCVPTDKTTIQDFKAILAAHPLTVWYRSTNYTEAADIPVSLETHVRYTQLFDGVKNKLFYNSIDGLAYGDTLLPFPAKSSTSLICNRAKVVDADTSYGKTYIANVTLTGIIMGLEGSDITSTDMLNAELQKNPFEIVYELATPITYAHEAVVLEASTGDQLTYTVTGQSGGTVSVTFKPSQDGGHAKTAENATNAITAQTAANSQQLDGLTLLAIKESMIPVGYIFSWAPVDDGPDLSTPAKVAEYFGFGTWQAYGTGQVLVGVDSGQTEFATVGKTGGEKAHSLTTAEGPKHAHGVKWEHEGGLGTGNGVLIKNANDGESYPYTYFTEFSGSGQAHNNLQPYITVYRWQRIA